MSKKKDEVMFTDINKDMYSKKKYTNHYCRLIFNFNLKPYKIYLIFYM